MIVHKAYKFRLKTNAVLTQHMACVAGCARLVWNKTLAEQKTRLGCGEGVQSYSTMCKALTVWKHTDTYAFLRDVPSQVLQQKLKDLRRPLPGGQCKIVAYRCVLTALSLMGYGGEAPARKIFLKRIR